MEDYPRVQLKGSMSYWNHYDNYEEIDSKFPGCDGYDFAWASSMADGEGPDLTKVAINKLIMCQQGYNDGPDWIWFVTTEVPEGQHDYHNMGDSWILQGGCDYTGWDCQASASWLKLGRW